jgi:small subunit ribosomal protein S19
MSNEVIVRSKELFYRGKNVDDLKKLDVREFAKYLNSRSRRSIMRHFDVVDKFVKRCEIAVTQNKKIKTHLRDIVIVPRLVGMTIGIYNGKTYNDVKILSNMIGHRLGEFSMTRQKVTHGNPGIGATKSSAGDKK